MNEDLRELLDPSDMDRLYGARAKVFRCSPALELLLRELLLSGALSVLPVVITAIHWSSSSCDSAAR